MPLTSGALSNHAPSGSAGSVAEGGGNGFPLSEWAGLGGHAQLGPGAASALAAAAGGVQRGGVPFGARAASRLSGGEGFGWGGGEACASEAVRG